MLQLHSTDAWFPYHLVSLCAILTNSFRQQVGGCLSLSHPKRTEDAGKRQKMNQDGMVEPMKTIWRSWSKLIPFGSFYRFIVSLFTSCGSKARWSPGSGPDKVQWTGEKFWLPVHPSTCLSIHMPIRLSNSMFISSFLCWFIHYEAWQRE